MTERRNMKIKNKNAYNAWEDLRRGMEFRRLSGNFAAISENERFYLGDQWYDSDSQGLPKPVFNMIRRLADYIVSTVLGYDIRMKFGFSPGAPVDGKLRAAADYTEEYVTTPEFANSVRKALRDAAISGDGFIYTWYDPAGKDEFSRIRTSVIDSRDIFPTDYSNPEIQSQEQIIIRGRASVGSLKEEGRLFGLSEKELAEIKAEDDEQIGQSYEPTDPDMAVTEYIVRFFRDENGEISFEKSVKNCVIRSARTGSVRYPIAHFSFVPVKNSFYGVTPISEIIGNQRYVNKAFALEMKHMNDTAFSKVIYDKRLIPEWSSDVGQAIGVMSGGDVSGAVTTVGVGEMQDNYIDIIDRVISYTKEMIGATDTALGDVDPTNTSAIMALREIAIVPLENLRSDLYFAIGEAMKNVAETEVVTNRELAGCKDKLCFLVPDVSTGSTRKYMPSVAMNVLDQLLAGGHITADEYLERIPEGIIENREDLIKKYRLKNSETEDNNGNQ